MMLFHYGLSRDFDGPGERLVLYFKGCNFNCDWCASPESISAEQELLYYQDRNTDRTNSNCPYNAYISDFVLNRDICRNCQSHSCINIWRNPAFEMAGEAVTVQDILQIVEKYSAIIDGVTFGGGEPTLQGAPLLECAEILHNSGIHTAMESNASTHFYKKMVGKVSLLYSDLKTLNPVIAKNRMHADISLVRENLLFAAEKQDDFILRIPVIKGVNNYTEEQEKLIDFCCEMQKIRGARPLCVELLRQHHLGEPKYKALGKPYLLQNEEATELAEVEAFAENLNRGGMKTNVFA